ncbi:MAG: hypothetical protein EOM64_04660 [Erysipelotrichia bacterium]|nr:hypothetical protein [Erysipelotrichia bacterium]
MIGFAVVFVIAVALIITAATVAAVASQKKSRGPISSDGHIVTPGQDLTCDRFGHQHPGNTAKDTADYGRQYIVHNDPEDGYVILNGIMRKITDCRNL